MDSIERRCERLERDKASTWYVLVTVVVFALTGTISDACRGHLPQQLERRIEALEQQQRGAAVGERGK